MREDGFTVNVFPVTVYVLAPEGTIVNVLPLQITPLVTDTVGNALTEAEKTAVLVDVHPLDAVPVMV